MRATRFLRAIDKCRIGFLGCGDISNLHASGVNQLESAELAGIWSRPDCPIVPDVPAKAAEYGTRAYGSAEELCGDPNIDAVYVLTNMETHLQVRSAACDEQMLPG
jgi:predicted dehydrogenase